MPKEQLDDDLELNDGIGELIRKTPTKRSFRWSKALLTISASLAIVLGLVILGFQLSKQFLIKPKLSHTEKIAQLDTQNQLLIASANTTLSHPENEPPTSNTPIHTSDIAVHSTPITDHETDSMPLEKSQTTQEAPIQIHSKKPTPLTKTETPALSKKTTPAPQKSQPSQQIKTSPSPTSKEKKLPPPIPQPNNTPTPDPYPYKVILGSFRNSDNARKLQAILQKSNIDTYLWAQYSEESKNSNTQTTTLYNVQASAHKTIEEARKKKAEFETKGLKATILIKK